MSRSQLDGPLKQWVQRLKLIYLMYCLDVLPCGTALYCRRYEMMMPADDGYQEVAALLSWHEAEAPPGGWVGPTPRQFLEQHCRANKVRWGWGGAGGAVVVGRGLQAA